jgi:altronate hydrolase
MDEAAEPSPRALVLDQADNVAVALEDIAAGEALTLEARRLTTRDPIRCGHKLAVEPIPPGGVVRKYAEVIGVASAEIQPGEHVHVHNVVSARLPGPELRRP